MTRGRRVNSIRARQRMQHGMRSLSIAQGLEWPHLADSAASPPGDTNAFNGRVRLTDKRYKSNPTGDPRGGHGLKLQYYIPRMRRQYKAA